MRDAGLTDFAGDVCIAAEAVGRRFGIRTVFSGVSLRAGVGQVCVVSGRNGAGKSTLLRILAGLLPPSEGRTSLAIDGVELDAQARRRAVGYVAPDLTLYRELTAAENLEFLARLRGQRPTRDDLIAVLTEVGLRGRGRDPVGAYSSGMRQRLKYANALLATPPVLLLDEPTANLDVDGIALVERVLTRHRAGGGAAVVATNEPRELDWGDSVVEILGTKGES